MTPTAKHASKARKKKRYKRRVPLPHEEMARLEREGARLREENALLREVLYAVVSQNPERIRAAVARAEANKLYRSHKKHVGKYYSADTKLEVMRQCDVAGPGHIAGVLRRYDIHPRTYYEWRRDFEKLGPMGLLGRWDRRKLEKVGIPNDVQAVLKLDRQEAARRLHARPGSYHEREELTFESVPPPPSESEIEKTSQSSLTLNTSEFPQKVRFVGEPPVPRRSNRKKRR